MQEKEKEEYLYFPQKIREKKEIAKGLDSKAFFACLVTAFSLSLIILMIYFITNRAMICLLSFFTAVSASYFAWATLDDSRTSLVDMMKYYIQFLKGQKRFYYHYFPEIVFTVEERRDKDDV